MYGDYFPQLDYGGGIAGSSSFSQAELQTVYGQSNDMNSLTLAAFKQYMEQSQQIVDKFNVRVGIMEVQADRMREDLVNAPSEVQQQIRIALDRNLQKQRALSATLMGPVGRVNDMLMNKNVRESHAIAVSGIGAHIQEDIARKSLYYQELDKNNKNIIASLGGMSQATMQGMNIAASMARGGLTTALGAASQLAGNRLTQMQQQIQEQEMALTWERSKLDAETNMYASNMAYKGGVEQAMMQANSMNYKTWMDARADTYDSFVKARAEQFKTNMWGALGTYGTNIQSRDARYAEDQNTARQAAENLNTAQIQWNHDQADLMRAHIAADSAERRALMHPGMAPGSIPGFNPTSIKDRIGAMEGIGRLVHPMFMRKKKDD